jgi:response regulator of citrate/malate metabolism
MADGLDVIIVDDDPAICEVVAEIVKRFYTWGDIFAFTDADEATIYCRNRDSEVAVFVLDVFLGGKSGFFFLDTIADKYPMAHEDTIIITGNASDDVVNMCVASDITSLLEKPIKPYALQLAIRSIVTKYLKFAKRVLRDSTFAESIARF